MLRLVRYFHLAVLLSLIALIVHQEPIYASGDSWLPTSTIGVPQGRTTFNRGGIWTGTEMLIWGGTDPSGTIVNTGARYNPVTDTWAPISTINAPSARRFHSAVWTGAEMIVWGGEDSAGILDTGAKYNPQTDTWAPISSVGAPVSRYVHRAVWTGKEMIVWGGRLDKSGNYPTNTGGRYDPATDTWKPISLQDAPTPRMEPTVLWTGSEMIVWGGYGGVDNCSVGGCQSLNTGARYNPQTDSWTPMTLLNVPAGISANAGVWTGSEMLVWGGNDVNGLPVNTGARYHPASDTWEPISTVNAPSPRGVGNGFVWTGSELIIWSGYDGTNYVNTGGRYNPASDTWVPTTLDGAPSPRGIEQSVWTGNAMVVWGGAGPNGTVLDTGGRYYPVQINSQPSVGALNINGAAGTACLSGNIVTLDFGFTDSGVNDNPWAVDINWGDGNHTTYTTSSQGSQPQQPHTYGVGSYTITVSVTDKDSGTGSNSSKTGEVAHLYLMSGILPPFNADGTSVWKYSSALPVKVKITDCSASPVPGLAPKIGTSLFSSNDPATPIDETPSTSEADTTGIMRYDPTEGQYIYNFGSQYLSDSSATYYMTVKGTDASGNIVTNPAIVQVKFGIRTK